MSDDPPNPLRFTNALVDSVLALDDISDQTVHSFNLAVARSPPESSSPRRPAATVPDPPQSPRHDPRPRPSPTGSADPVPSRRQQHAANASPTTEVSGRRSSNATAPYDPQFAPGATNFTFPSTHGSPPNYQNWVFPGEATPFDPSQILQQGPRHDPYAFDQAAAQPMHFGMQQPRPMATNAGQGFQPIVLQQLPQQQAHPSLQISTASQMNPQMGMMNASSPGYADFSIHQNLDLGNHTSSSSSASSPSPKTAPAGTPTGYGPSAMYAPRAPHRSSRPSPTPESMGREHGQPYPRPVGNRLPRHRPSSDGNHGTSLQQAYMSGASDVSPLQGQRKQSFGHLQAAARPRRTKGHHQLEHQPQMQSRPSYESTAGVFLPSSMHPTQIHPRSSLDGAMGSPPSATPSDYSILSAASRTSSSDSSSLAAWNSTEDLPSSSYEFGDGFMSGFSPTLATVNQEPSEQAGQQVVPVSPPWNPPPAESIQR